MVILDTVGYGDTVSSAITAASSSSVNFGTI